MAADSGKTINTDAINAIEDPRSFLLGACKSGSSKYISTATLLVKRALGAGADKFLATCKGNAVNWTKANRKAIVAALEAAGSPAVAKK
jgi:hypothetical protein